MAKTNFLFWCVFVEFSLQLILVIQFFDYRIGFSNSWSNTGWTVPYEIPNSKSSRFFLQLLTFLLQHFPLVLLMFLIQNFPRFFVVVHIGLQSGYVSTNSEVVLDLRLYSAIRANSSSIVCYRLKLGKNAETIFLMDFNRFSLFF